MKILIASLQVSSSASRGHLHPAIELALACRRRGHDPVLLPLPNRLGEEDHAFVNRLGIPVLSPRPLPSGIAKSAAELALFASDPNQTWKAYHAFLVAPLKHQYAEVKNILAEQKPDIILYDLLAYSAPLAARSLGIPDVGYCAGLKLIAPDRLQESYLRTREKLTPDLTKFLEGLGIEARFHYLELLSDHAQFVFTSESIVGALTQEIPNAHLAGPLPVSHEREMEGTEIHIPEHDFAVLSLGSVFDPADLPEITGAVIRSTQDAGLKLLISSKRLAGESIASHVRVHDYLPIPRLLGQAKVFFHHGGANTFSEAFRQGCPQILIPISTDQPIQAHYLDLSGAGFSLKPKEVSTDSVKPLLGRILDKADPIHDAIARIKSDFRSRNGASFAVEKLENIVRSSRPRPEGAQ